MDTPAAQLVEERRQAASGCPRIKRRRATCGSAGAGVDSKERISRIDDKRLCLGRSKKRFGGLLIGDGGVKAAPRRKTEFPHAELDRKRCECAQRLSFNAPERCGDAGREYRSIVVQRAKPWARLPTERDLFDERKLCCDGRVYLKSCGFGKIAHPRSRVRTAHVQESMPGANGCVCRCLESSGAEPSRPLWSIDSERDLCFFADSNGLEANVRPLIVQREKSCPIDNETKFARELPQGLIFGKTVLKLSREAANITSFSWVEAGKRVHHDVANGFGVRAGIEQPKHRKVGPKPG